MTEDVSYRDRLLKEVFIQFHKNEIIKEFDQQLLLVKFYKSLKHDDLDGDISNKIMVEVDNYSDNQHVVVVMILF